MRERERERKRQMARDRSERYETQRLKEDNYTIYIQHRVLRTGRKSRNGRKKRREEI